MQPPAYVFESRKVKVPLPLLDQVERRSERAIKQAGPEHAPDVGYKAFLIRKLTEWANHSIPTPRLAVDFDGQRTPIPEPEARHYDQQRKVETHMVSFRLSVGLWAAATDRAAAEHTTISAVANRFLRGYADGRIS